VEIRKALDLSSSAAAYLLPEVVDGAIRDFASKTPTMYNAVQKQPWGSQTYFIKKKLTLPTATWSIDGGPLPAATTGSYGQMSKSVSYLYTRGEVTGPMIEAAGSVFDALGQEIEDHQQAIVEQLSTDIVSGDGSTNNIQGILYQIETDSSLYTEVGGAGQVLDAGGAYLTLLMLDKAIDMAAESTGTGIAGPGATVAVTTRPVLRMINTLLQQYQRFLAPTEIQAGFRVMSYDGLPFITENHWSGNTNNQILFFDATKARLLVHKDWTYEELAKTKDSVDFFIKGYFGFKLEGAASLLKNFTLSSGIV
jgi:HK97 family phage major capsid protein